MKKTIILLMFLLMIPIGVSYFIDGFEEFKNAGNIVINASGSSQIALWTNDILRILIHPNGTTVIGTEIDPIILQIEGNITLTDTINGSRLGGNIDCSEIDGGTDGDFCADATAAGGGDSDSQDIFNVSMADNDTIIRVGTERTSLINNTDAIINKLNATLNISIWTVISSDSGTTVPTVDGSTLTFAGSGTITTSISGDTITILGNPHVTNTTIEITEDQVSNLGIPNTQDWINNLTIVNSSISQWNISQTTISPALNTTKIGIGTIDASADIEIITGNISITGTGNSSINGFDIILFNSSCRGFRFGPTGGGIFSCRP